jgi:hypothetical protein
VGLSLWVPNILSPLCGLGIFADQAAEPVPPQDPDIRAHSGQTLTPGWRALAQSPVRAMAVVMIGVLAQDQPQVPFAGDQHPVQALAVGTAIQRSAIAFARGARTGVPMIRTAAEETTASNAAVPKVPERVTFAQPDPRTLPSSVKRKTSGQRLRQSNRHSQVPRPTALPAVTARQGVDQPATRNPPDCHLTTNHRSSLMSHLV